MARIVTGEIMLRLKSPALERFFQSPLKRRRRRKLFPSPRNAAFVSSAEQRDRRGLPARCPQLVDVSNIKMWMAHGHLLPGDRLQPEE